jgi:hypothetical protein
MLETMNKGCLGILIGIPIVIVLAWYNWEYLTRRTAPPAWASESQCVSQHIRFSEGSYPQPGDDVAELHAFCHRAVTENLFCGFDCMVTSVGWEFAVSAPQDRRATHLRAYFNRRR